MSAFQVSNRTGQRQPELYNGAAVRQKKQSGNEAQPPHRRDSVEISDAAYKMSKETDELRATSGKDELRVTKGNRENEVIVHFRDSALVNRTVSRGYITVNGKDIVLSDETKEALLNTDKEAEEKRRKAYESYVMEHEAAVAKQQGEALSRAYEELFEELLGLSDSEKTVKEKDIPKGVSWSDFGWETYDTSLSLFV